jgi:stalled ribosome rescue protein Dom34
MKKVGIWLDKRDAKIVSLQDEKEALTHIKSEIEEYNPKGGSGSKNKGGPQDVVQDSKYTNREKQQLRTFFNRIINHIKEADAIVIAGPAETGAKLNKELEQNHHDLHAKVSEVSKADVMTDNQLKAWVRSYFD